MAARSKRRRPPPGTLALRWLAVGGLVVVALLYYRPLRTYLHTRHALSERAAEVRALRAEKRSLERRVTASTSADALTREARRLGLVKPGERLFIVKGIDAWLRAHSTIRRGG
jgi:cell division protein FtsB